jgi:type IX secretion system PorP/SprF family membrane protein
LYWVVGLSFSFFPFNVLAQQDPGLSMFSFNKMTLNPAFSGLNGESYAQLHYRNQWTQYQSTYDGSGNLGTQMVGISLPIPKINIGASLFYMSDYTPSGVGQQFVNLQFAKHFQIGGGQISAGLRLGISSKSFDGRVFKPRDANDPIIDPLSGNSISQSLPNIGLGLIYSKDNYSIGFNADHLNSPSFSFQNSAFVVLRPIYTVHGNVDFVLSSNIEIQPFAALRYYSGRFLPEGGSRIKLFDAFWIGGSYRWNDAVIGMIGFSALKQKLEIGYSLDNTLVGATVKAPLSHEIFIKFLLPSLKSSIKGIPIKTPRFKIL